MKILHTATGEYKDAEVVRVAEKDYDYIKNCGRFVFDWRTENQRGFEVYKIALKEREHHILGLLSLRDIQQELRIHVNSVEVSSENIGAGKIYDRIAGSLLGFACQLAFEKSYDGFVSLIPKTDLIDHYCQKYGFSRVGKSLAVEGASSLAIIQNYL
jgi:hypothetical protein